MNRGEVEEEVCPLSTAEPLSLVTDVRGTLIVSSIRALRENGHMDVYRAALAKVTPEHQERILMIVAGEWVPIAIADAHYRACEATGIAGSEVARMGGSVAQWMHSGFFSTLMKIARTTGVTPWAGLSQIPRVFASSFRGGGGLRVVKVGPKEARIEVRALPLMGMAWCRHGWRGMIVANAELLCDRARCTEVEAGATSATFRLAWV